MEVWAIRLAGRKVRQDAPGEKQVARRGAEQIAYYREHPTLENIPGKDDLFYSTAIPWVSFTSFMHPMQLHPADCIPRFAWGKYFEEGKRIKMSLSVQGHHTLMDGVHMGMFYARMQECLDHPDLLDPV